MPGELWFLANVDLHLLHFADPLLLEMTIEGLEHRVVSIEENQKEIQRRLGAIEQALKVQVPTRTEPLMEDEQYDEYESFDQYVNSKTTLVPATTTHPRTTSVPASTPHPKISPPPATTSHQSSTVPMSTSRSHCTAKKHTNSVAHPTQL